MEPPAHDPPYRTELTSAYERIAELERQIAQLAAAAAGNAAPSGPLAQLKLAHLREDRDLAIARYRARRSAVFVGTAAGMLATFAAAWVRLWGVAPGPGMIAGWALCGAAVTTLALLGWLAQRVLRARAAGAVRALDRRIAEAQLVAGGAGEARAGDKRVRVTVEPAGLEDVASADPLLEARIEGDREGAIGRGR